MRGNSFHRRVTDEDRRSGGGCQTGNQEVAIPRYIGITTVDLQTRCLVQSYPRSSGGRNVNASSPAPPMVWSM